MKWPLHKEELENLIWLNSAGVIVVDSRVKGWDEIFPFIEDNIIDTPDGDNDQDIYWPEVWADYDDQTKPLGG